MEYTVYDLYESSIGNKLRKSGTVVQYIGVAALLVAIAIGAMLEVFIISLIYGLISAFCCYVSGLIMRGLATLVDHAELALLNDAVEKEQISQPKISEDDEKAQLEADLDAILQSSDD